jgi:hypothetical protein
MSEPGERFPPVMGELPPIEISRDLAFRHPANTAAVTSSRGVPARHDGDNLFSS